MLDRRSLLSAGAATVMAAPGLAHAQVKDQVAVMRFAMRGDQPVTTVFIGDKGPYLVLIDTGNAVGCVLKTSILEKLQLQRTQAGRLYGATGTDAVFGYAAHNVTFGQAVFEKDVTFIGGREDSALDGILPLSIFAARPTDIDFTRGEVRIQLSGSVDRTGFRPLHSERVHRDAGAFVIDAVVDGFPARLAVDTGAGTTVAMLPGWVGQHGLWSKHPRYVEHHFGGVTAQKGLSRTVRSPMVQVGPYRFKDVAISLSDPSMRVLGGVDGLLGIQLLRRFTLGFDAGASTVWMKPNESLTDPFFYDHSGLTWDFKEGKVVVVAVAAESPALAAGVKVGDVVPGYGSAREALRFEARLDGDPDTEVDFEVLRDGQRVPIKMILKDWL